MSTELKILLVHNYYGSSAPSGENTVYDAEKSLLKSAGQGVVEFTRHSDEIRCQGIWGAIKGGVSVPWNPFIYTSMRRTIEQQSPDIMHVHNTFPLISPAVFHSAAKTSTATVLTLHNYRTVCAAAIPMRQGKPCTECIDKQTVAPAVKYGCYRQSRLATLALATSISLHRYLRTWEKQVDAFIALTEFHRDLLIKAGLPANRIHVKPHFYSNVPALIPWESREEKVVFIGRLGEEKGVRYLIDAWRQWGEQAPLLELIGDGPLRLELERSIQGEGNRIRFLGQLSFAETQERLARSRLLVLPSICFEGFPMVIREAFALGVPVAASRLGSMPCLIEDGRTGGLFKAADAQDLARCLKILWISQRDLGQKAAAAHAEFEAKYMAESNYDTLMEIYQAAIANRLNKQRKGQV